MQLNAVVETNIAAVHLLQSLAFAIMTTIPKCSSIRGMDGLGCM